MSSIGKVNAALAAVAPHILPLQHGRQPGLGPPHPRGTKRFIAVFHRDRQSRAAALRVCRFRDPSLLQQQADVVSQLRNSVSEIQRLTADNPPPTSRYTRTW